MNSPPMTKELQPHAACPHLRSSSLTHSSPPSKEQQLCEWLDLVRGAAAA